MSRFIQTLKESFSFDPYSLAIYRVFIGIIVMIDVLYRLPDLSVFYTDQGILPRANYLNDLAYPWSFSLHMANGSFIFIAVMFFLHFLSGLFLSVGFKTRLSTIAAFVFTISVHNRNWLINNGGDDILRSILFLSIFLPLGRFFSVDRALTKDGIKEDKPYFSIWNLTFFLQMFMIYFFSYMLKNHPIWRMDYTAVHYALELDIFATPIAVWLRNFPFILKVLTFITIMIEWLAPLLFIFSFIAGKRWWIPRLISVALLMSLHVGIIFTLWIGVFPYLCLSIWLLFLPPKFWEKIKQNTRENEKRAWIYYDGECGFCLKGVLILKQFILLPEIKIEKAQADPKINSLMIDNHSWVVKVDDQYFFKYQAFIELLKLSPFKFLRFFFDNKFVFKVGDLKYTWISHHREYFGKITQFLNFKEKIKPVKSLSYLSEAFGVFVFLNIFLWNVTYFDFVKVRYPWVDSFTRSLHLYQKWDMFSPYPKLDDIWLEVTGVFQNGESKELLTQKQILPSTGKDLFTKNIPNEHWRKFYLNISEEINHARYLGNYLCQKYNQEKLLKIIVDVYSQLNNLDQLESDKNLIKSTEFNCW